MAPHSISLDIASALAPPRICAACGSGNLLAVADDEGVMFTCPQCRRDWILELGQLVPADPDRLLAGPEDGNDVRRVPGQRGP